MAVTAKKAKTICIVLISVWSALICAAILPLGFWLVLFAPDMNSVRYYSDPANYVSFDGSVRSFVIGEDSVTFELDHSQKGFADEFTIEEKNFDLAVENGLLDILQKDAVFTITSANAYLGDGWAYPVVALTYEGKEIIPYEEGMQNTIEVRQEAETFATTYIVILGSIVGVLAVFDVCPIIGLVTAIRKNRAERHAQ